MKGLCRLIPAIIFVATFTALSFGSATDIYITPDGNGQGVCTNSPHNPAWFNSAGNWGSGASQIGPGTTVHICGTFDAGGNHTNQVLTFQGSGTSGHPITLLFEAGAIVQAQVCPDNGGGTGNGGCISMFNRSWITIDGGNTGQATQGTLSGGGTVRNTDNGDNLGHHCGSSGSPTSDCLTTLVDGYKCTNCTVKNLKLVNAYVKVAGNSSTGVGGDQQHSNTMSGSNWTFTNNVVDHCGWCVFQNFANGDNNTQIYNNQISNFGHALMYATAGANAASNYFLHDNYIHDSYVWAAPPSCPFHNDGLHTFTTGGGSMDGVYIYNNWWGGQWTKNTDSSSCATGFIFIESGDFSPSNARNVVVWNNLAVVPSNSYPNTNGWFGLFECRGGTCLVANNTFIGPNSGSGGDNTLCLSIQKQTNLQAYNNVVAPCGNPIEISNSSLASVTNNDFGPSCQNGNNCFMWNGSYTGSYSSFVSHCNCNAGGFQNNSMQLNADGSPQDGSPIVDAGANLSGMANGTLIALAMDTSAGNTRNPTGRAPSGSWTSGAYNSGSGGGNDPQPPTGLEADVK